MRKNKFALKSLSVSRMEYKLIIVFQCVKTQLETLPEYELNLNQELSQEVGN